MQTYGTTQYILLMPSLTKELRNMMYVLVQLQMFKMLSTCIDAQF